MMLFRSSAPRSSRSMINLPSSSSPSLLSSLPSSQPSHNLQQPRRHPHRHSPLPLSIICFVLFQTLFFTVSEAFQCTYPNYDTEVQPGQNSLLTWQASSTDLSTYDSITATLYCMDIDGQYGGIWRTISTLFSNRGLISAQGQYQFNVPNCGQLAHDVAIRIVARGKGSTTTQNGACYFMMDPKVAATTPPPPPPPVTSSTSSRLTTNPVQPTTPPKSSLTTTPSGAASTSAVQPVTTGSSSSLSTIAPVGTIPTGSTNGGVSDGRPPNLPPLPPLPEDPSAQGGTSVKSSHAATIGATLGSICGFAIIAAVASFLVLRRRRARHRHPRDRTESGSLKKRMRLQGRRLKGSMKDENDHFHMMHDDDYDEDDHDISEKPQQVKSITVQSQKKDLPDMITVRAVSAVPSVPTVAKPPSLMDDISELHLGAWRQSSILSYPPLAHLPSSDEWKRSSSSSSVPMPSPTSEAFSISSSAQVKGDEEVSSVVRNYWAAAMAARAERSTLALPSTSSQSHKADILGFDDTPTSSRTGRRHDSIEEGEESEDLDAAYKGWVRNPFRSTVNSIQSYVNRSISTGLQSRLRSFTTFNSSTPSSNFFDDSSSYMTEENQMSHQQAFGFHTRVNSEFLEHLNIKALRHEQRQLEYYTRYYSEHCPVVPSVIETSISMTNESRRTSSVPSLTSTNDPFQTFDSNEIIVMDTELERDPFADPVQEPIDKAASPVIAATTYVPPPLPPPQLVIAHKDLAVEAKEQDRSNSVILRSFPDPPSSPTSVASHSSTK